jgi:gliding motility-associated-like protein
LTVPASEATSYVACGKISSCTPYKFPHSGRADYDLQLFEINLPKAANLKLNCSFYRSMYHMRFLATILGVCIVIFSKAQQFNTWYFGSAAGISFNPGGNSTPHALTDGINASYEGNSGICDDDGNILFYTNGETVYNRNHQVMLNGSGLLGHQSAAQSSIIVPLPNSINIYYIFTTDAVENYFANGYRYSVVDMSHDSGKGEVVTKNILLNASCTERLTAVRHADGVDVWIIGNEKNSNIFKCWLLTCNGLQAAPVVSATGAVLNGQDLGMLKASPDGKFICQTNYADVAGNFFQLFDFNNATGILSNPRSISNTTASYFDCEFSPDSKLLYVTRVFEQFIDQFEVSSGSAATINSTRVSIPAAYGFYGIQAAPDGKIYLDHYKTKLSVISRPNIKGTGCDFILDQVDLAGRSGVLGLPNTINDIPFDPYNNFTYEVTDTCTGTIQFTAFSNLNGSVQWAWDFGDGSSSNLQNPVHTFLSSNKIYNVKLVIRSSSVCGWITRGKYIAAGGVLSDANFDFVPKCDSGYVRFINKSAIYPDTTISYQWDFGDGNISSEKNPIHVYANSGTFKVQLKISSGAACLDDSISKALDLQQLDIHALPGNTQIDIGQTVQLGISGGGTHFKWTPATWLNDETIDDPVATPLDNITYKVVVTNDAGCIDEDSVIIKVAAPNDIYIPSAFTPNNDGINDVFKPSVGTNFALINFSVYNRWGEKVFTTSNNNGWDGTTNGQAQNTGVYIWILSAKDNQGNPINKKGTVTLIR